VADQTGPRCGNNPNFRMSDGDQKAVNDFKARLALQAAAKPYIADAVWVDGDPLMEVIAVTLWEHCVRDDKDMPLAVCDDPRTIAAFAAAVVRAYAVVQEPATELPDRLAAALTARFTELGNPFSRMVVHEQGPDGWPVTHPVGPNRVAEVLRELMAEQPAVEAQQQPKETRS